MKKYLLFDLDGTLTDPREGITGCVQYALKQCGIDEPDLQKLEAFIGPPLQESFMEFYHMSGQQAAEAVAKYRERFENRGIFENQLYEGIPKMLRSLKARGLKLAVASSKPTVFVERILEYFKIDKFFDVVVGSELDGTRVKKDEVIREALLRLFGDLPVKCEEVYMIGDRRFDIEGARAMRVESVGVTYGYGSMEELKEAKADYIVRSVEELRRFLLRGTEEVQLKGAGFQRIWVMLYAFLMFMLVRNMVLYGLNWVLFQAGEHLKGAAADFLIMRDEAGIFIGFTGNAATLMSMLAFICGAAAIWPNAKMLITRTAEDSRLSHLKPEPTKHYVLLGLGTFCAVVGLNLLFELLEVTSKSEAYQAVVEDQYSAHFLVGILCYGLVTPIAEELLFRGIIYNYLKRFTKLKAALVLSAFIFGAYHMNAIQGSYAFIMGLLIAYAYEFFGSFKIPVLMHMISNIVAYSLSYTSIAVSGFVSWPVCVAFLMLAGELLWTLKKKKKLI